MDSKKIKQILKSVKEGKTSIQDALILFKHMPYEDIGVAMVDHHRELRHGIPEVIFARGKERDDVQRIAGSMIEKSGKVLVTKASEDHYKDIRKICRRHGINAHYYKRSGVIAAGGSQEKRGLVAVLCAGTSDMAIAEEALAAAEFLGSRTEAVNDVGVAGLHRIVNARNILSEAHVLIVAAGMEGALPSVVGGMTDKPIVAVPTSVGYGTSFGGLTALFAMLNSCVPGIAVMNIDNGFGAGVLGHKINMLTVKR
ncbi:MAG: nickel pincer cofactor biosynthesis protein LarB [Nitrospiraceae bacterium]|nr:MAG: nickel pincer cofactor biosynthesis protein LarB [Nitrospiraceae bacterium]